MNHDHEAHCPAQDGNEKACTCIKGVYRVGDHPHDPPLKNCLRCIAWTPTRHVNAAIRIVKKPVPIEAMRFTGTNAGDIRKWMFPHVKQVGHPSTWFLMAHEAARSAITVPGEAHAVVYDYLHETWVGVTTGQWIMHGTEGEFYPCADDGTGNFPLNYQEAP